MGCLTQTKYSTYMYMYIICTTSNAYIWVFVRRWWLYSPGKCVLFEASWMSEFSAVKCGWRCWCDTWWMCVGRGRVNCRWVLLFCCSSLFSTDIFCMNSSHNRCRRLSTGHTQCTRYRRPCPYDPPTPLVFVPSFAKATVEMCGKIMTAFYVGLCVYILFGGKPWRLA